MTRKKVLSLMLSLLMILCLVPAGALTASAAESYGDYEYLDLGDTIYIDKYVGSDSVVTVPSEINGKPVTVVGDQVFAETNVTEVTIPEGVTEIASRCFQYCDKLTRVNMPSTLTTIGSMAFKESTVQTIEMPDSVTGLGQEVFQDCSALVSVHLSENLTTIPKYTFDGCTALTDVNIPEGVTEIGSSAFRKCTSLTEITLPQSLTTMGGTVFSQSGLTSILIPDQVQTIPSAAFALCYDLTEITIPNSVTEIESGVFQACNSLTAVHYLGTAAEWDQITISDVTQDELQNITVLFEGSEPDPDPYIDFQYTVNEDDTVTITGYNGSDSDITIPGEIDEMPVSIGTSAFYGCSGLTSVFISDGVTTIGDSAFDGCSGLTIVTIPDSVTGIGDDAFTGCGNLTSIAVSDNNSSYSSQDGVLFNKAKTELIQYPTGKTETAYAVPDSVTGIGNNAFSRCLNLTAVTIPDSVTGIGNGAFNGCSNLMSFAVSDNNSSYSSQDGVLFNKDKTELIQYPVGKTETAYAVPDGVTSIGSGAFAQCQSLTDVTIPNSVTIIGEQAFLNCKNLENAEMGTGVTTIGRFAFLSCKNLHNLTIPESVSEIGAQAFHGSGIRSLTIPGGVKNIPYGLCLLCPDLEELILKEGVETIENEAFNSCKSLKTVVLPEGLKTIGGLAFNKCISLESVTIPGSIEEFGSMCFISCENLRSVVIKEGVKHIGDFAFAANTNLKTVDIPSSITVIETGVFSQCNKLTDINYAGTRNQWEAITVHPINECIQNASIHCLTKIQITDKMIGTIASQTYTGKALAPKVTVKDGTKTLTKETDYTVAYKDNVNAGTASVIIKGIGDYTGSITKTFTITKAAPTLTFASTKLTKTFGNAAFTNKLTKKTDGAVTFTSNNTSVATVNKTTGQVTIKGAGTATIKATAAAGKNYKAGSASYTLTVKKAANRITASNFTKTASASGAQTFAIGATRLGGAKLTYTSNNSNVTVSTAGKVTIKKNFSGKATITIKAAATANYNAATKNITVTVNPSKTAIATLKNTAAKTATVTWKKNTTGSGYQIQYSTDKTFKSGVKSATVTKNTILSKKLTSLTKGKTYYVRMRTVKTVSSMKYYSAWSAAKYVKITK